MHFLDFIRKQNYEEKEPGLYSKHGILKMSWNELLKNRMICVSRNMLYAGYNNYKLEGILIISKKIEIIAFRSFTSCQGLTAVYLQDGIKRIENEAFQNCKNLETISLPYSLYMIGEQAFCGCEKLQKLYMKEGMKHIETQAFDGCTALRTLEMPETIVSIGPCAFGQCVHLQEILYKGAVYSDKDQIIHRLQNDDVLVNKSAFVVSSVEA